MSKKEDRSTEFIASQKPKRVHRAYGAASFRIVANGQLSIQGHAPEVIVSELEKHDPASSLGLILHSSRILVLGDKSQRGERVLSTTPIFWELIKYAAENGAEALHGLLPADGRLFEELIAGVYSESGAIIVDLTTHSDDGGVDVWAEYQLPNLGNVTAMDQVRLYRPDRGIKPEDVFRILGADHRGDRYSKAVISTTGRFPPVTRREVQTYGERVELRDAEILGSVFRALLHQKDNN